MKVSGFTFIRNGVQLGFPFIQSIRSLLPIVDEFIINIGDSNDDTKAQIQAINDPKIKIIETVWNNHMQQSGFVYGQQKIIAQYSCTGDWAFYLEADEIIHENDYDVIVGAMKKHLSNPKIEALVFDYLHFYGNTNTYLWSPAWYRREARIIKTSVRSYAPDGLFWVVLQSNKKGRYPRAVLTGAKIYHYGWVRNKDQMSEKLAQVEHLWDKKNQALDLNYKNIDNTILREFIDTHPQILGDFFPKENGIFQVDFNHVLTRKERKNRMVAKIERLFNLELSKKHFRLVKIG